MIANITPGSSAASRSTDIQPLVAVVGPTASGKTDAAITIALAAGGEIVNADSRQVYRGMAIGTAQPDTAQLQIVPHHLIGTVAPDEPYGLARYLDEAYAAIAAIRRRHRVPILVGGTGQYVWALLEGWTVPRVEPDPARRRAREAFAREHGAAALHLQLQQVDPAAAMRIHPHNVRRVSRALEVYEETGTPISAQQQRRQVEGAVVLGLDLPRALLYQRIDHRVQEMYTTGFVDEVRALDAQGYRRDLPSMAAIGYPEAWAVLQDAQPVEEAVQCTQIATRRLARRQGAWFGTGDSRITWLDASAAGFEQRLIAAAVARLRM